MYPSIIISFYCRIIPPCLAADDHHVVHSVPGGQGPPPGDEELPGRLDRDPSAQVGLGVRKAGADIRHRQGEPGPGH